jgi:hypothetical protein
METSKRTARAQLPVPCVSLIEVLPASSERTGSAAVLLCCARQQRERRDVYDSYTGAAKQSAHCSPISLVLDHPHDALLGGPCLRWRGDRCALSSAPRWARPRRRFRRAWSSRRPAAARRRGSRRSVSRRSRVEAQGRRRRYDRPPFSTQADASMHDEKCAYHGIATVLEDGQFECQEYQQHPAGRAAGLRRGAM